jgi:hypothetical protein
MLGAMLLLLGLHLMANASTSMLQQPNFTCVAPAQEISCGVANMV